MNPRHSDEGASGSGKQYRYYFVPGTAEDVTCTVIDLVKL